MRIWRRSEANSSAASHTNPVVLRKTFSNPHCLQSILSDSHIRLRLQLEDQTEMAIKVGINGFGRIGRNLFRAAMGEKDIEIVAVNDITSPDALAYLLKHDSVLGNLKANVSSVADGIVVDGHSVHVFKERDPGEM